MQSVKRILSGIIGLVVLLGLVWLANLGAASPTPAPSRAQATSAPATATPGRATATPRPRAATPTARAAADGLPTIALDRLPPEAWDTIALIDQGGPFPYRNDDATFGNRERLLPRQPAGYYREYTVITPGSDDRGARRVVAGADGELYYTDDHYASFQRVVR